MRVRALLASEGKRFERAAVELPTPGVEPLAFYAVIDDGDDQPLGTVVDRRAS